MGLPMYVKDGKVYLAISEWEFIGEIVANSDAREKFADEIAKITLSLESSCANCGRCCRETEHMILHDYEAPRIAYLLKEYFGTDAVRKHIYHRPISFNYFTQYLFHFKDVCPFLENDRCLIEDYRPMVCKLYPLFFEYFVDRDSPVLRQEPIFSTSIYLDAPCEDDLKRVHAILKEANGGTLARAVVWNRLSDRPMDIAFLFARPSEPTGSDRFIDATKYDEKVFISLKLDVWNAYNAILGGIPNVLSAPETLGALPLEMEHAEQLASKNAMEEATNSVDDVMNRMLNDYGEMIVRNLQERGEL